MEALYEIGCCCGRFILSSAFLMLIYWFLLRKNASFIFSRIYLLSIPFQSLAMAFLSIEIGEKDTTVVYVESGSYAAASSDTAVNTAISDNIESSSIADNLHPGSFKGPLLYIQGDHLRRDPLFDQIDGYVSMISPDICNRGALCHKTSNCM